MLLRLCCVSGNVCALPVVSQIFIECRHPCGTGWWCFGCVLALQVHQMHTSGSSCHTLAADVIRWAWLNILYLMHVLYVVYVAIGTPPPTSLVYYLN